MWHIYTSFHVQGHIILTNLIYAWKLSNVEIYFSLYIHTNFLFMQSINLLHFFRITCCSPTSGEMENIRRSKKKFVTLSNMTVENTLMKFLKSTVGFTRSSALFDSTMSKSMTTMPMIMNIAQTGLDFGVLVDSSPRHMYCGVGGDQLDGALQSSIIISVYLDSLTYSSMRISFLHNFFPSGFHMTMWRVSVQE